MRSSFSVSVLATLLVVPWENPPVQDSAAAKARQKTPVVVFADNFENGKRAESMPGGKWLQSGRRVSVESGGAADSKFALDFFYPARDSGRMSTAEQRFVLTKGVTELWIEYDLFVPANFRHREPKSNSNNKFLALWQEEYSGAGGTPIIIFEYRPMGDNSNRVGKPGDSYLYVHARDRAGRMRNRGRPGLNAFTDAQRNRWNQVRVHVRLASTDAMDDGLIEVWLNGTRIIEADGLSLQSAKRNYIRRGYFMGWSNSGYEQDTHFKIDNVRFLTTPS
jgi:hypothetical protein